MPALTVCQRVINLEKPINLEIIRDCAVLHETTSICMEVFSFIGSSGLVGFSGECFD